MVAAIKKIINEAVLNDYTISRAKAGDLDAFEAIVKGYQKKVFICAYGMLMNREDAMETVQETFMKIYKSFGTLKDDLKFEPWLFTITNNLCIDRLRKNKNLKLQRTPIEDISELEMPANQNFDKDRDTEHFKNAIKNCIQTLPKRQKTIIIMRYFQDLKFGEIAGTLGISIGTVKKLHFSALAKLKEKAARTWSL
jgi:RNA polymerase sigma-70 factor (ECF subfamily)